MKDKVLSLLGLAQKARKIESGEFCTENAIKAFKAELVIVAEDASDNTKHMFQNMCEFYECLYVEYSSKEQLGHAIGKEFRASVAVCDENFAKNIYDKIESGKTTE